MPTNPIFYKDLVSPDDSIKNLIEQLKDLKSTYGELLSLVKDNAVSIQANLKKTGSTTEEGRKQIDEATAASSRLERAQKELAFALSETGKQVAWLKAQTVSANKATVEQQRTLQQAVTSYDRIKSDLKSLVSSYKSLTEAERNESQVGQQLLDQILQYKSRLAALDAQMKPHIQTLSALEKAKQKLAYLQSEEGKQLLDIQSKIRAEIAARKEQKTQLTALERVRLKLKQAQSEENVQIKLYNSQIREANEVARLNAAIASNAEGSYNRLSAQYSLNKIQLNKMSAEERSATQAGQELEKQTADIYKEMIRLQEATGNYKLSVGNYKKAWDGLGMSVNQIVREIPAAAISLNTFFLGISNNIPVLLDEISKLKKVNAELIAQGKSARSVTGAVIKSLFSLNTVVVLLLTAFSMNGDKIIAWIGSLFKAKAAVISTKDALDNIAKELESTNGSYGDNIVSLKKLQQEYKGLKTTAEKNQWIKDNKTEFDKLGVSVNDVTDAENIFVKNTKAVIDALKARAMAAAAEKLAAKKYEEALILRNKAETEAKKGPSVGDVLKNAFVQSTLRGTQDGNIVSQSNIDVANRLSAESFKEERIKGYEEEFKAAKETGDAYFYLASGYREVEKAALEKAGIRPNSKTGGEAGGRQPRDAEDTLESLSLAATKAYQESVTELEREEIKKRRKETLEAYNVEVADLQKKYNKIQRILDGQDERYKQLTEEQKNQAIKAQEDIVNAIANIQSKTSTDLSNLTYADQEHALSVMLETTELQAKAAKEGSEEELRLRLRILEIERQIAIARNKQLPPSEQQSESDINAGFAKQRTGIVTDYNMTSFDQQQALAEAEFNAVEHAEDEITRFKLQQEKDRWLQLIALAEAGSLDWSQTQIDTAKATVKGIDKELSDLDDVLNQLAEKGVSGTILSKLGFDDDAIQAFDEAVNTVVSNLQEIVQAEIDIAQAAVDAAQERVDAAQSAYEAEVEARNNGYANNVATAKKELEQEKKNQLEKQKLLEAAQRRQESLNTVTQASSLITASANIWSSMSSIPIVGPALALAAIATMWTSFAAAKIKARQVTTSSSEEYGEGGFEVLEGGSHASGNDIDLGVKNKRKKRMKAEGGEALAIINKRNTSKYKKVLPDVIESFNKGIFEEKYSKAFEYADNVNMTNVNNTSVDMSVVEQKLEQIRKQGETKYFVGPNGEIIEVKNNVKRVIR